jgi:hypothetical protein
MSASRKFHAVKSIATLVVVPDDEPAAKCLVCDILPATAFNAKTCTPLSTKGQYILGARYAI